MLLKIGRNPATRNCSKHSASGKAHDLDKLPRKNICAGQLGLPQLLQFGNKDLFVPFSSYLPSTSTFVRSPFTPKGMTAKLETILAKQAKGNFILRVGDAEAH